MNLDFRIFFGVLSLAFLAVVSGCGKKPAPTPVGTERPPAPPVGEVQPAEEKPVPPTSSALEKADGSPASATPTPSVSPELMASDAAYSAWFEKYNLDLNDPNMLEADADGDGFTNGEEFLGGTNPLDVDSHPANHAGAHPSIEMKGYSEVDLPFVLKSVEGDEAVVERLDEEPKKTETVKAGQTLRNTGYTIERVIPRRGRDKEGNDVDASRVTLVRQGSKEKTILVKDLRTRSAETYATLVSTDGKTSLNVRAGETFSWPGGVTYKVIDLGSGQVVLQEVESGKMWTVPKH